jgi:hypothetical protein
VELFIPTTVVISSLEGEKYVTQSLILLQLCHLESSVIAVQTKCMLANLLISIISKFT